jgi:hypothetical protein
MDNTNDIPNEEQTGRLQQPDVSRIFSSAEEAREYMRSEGLDPEAEEAFGREAIKKLKATVAKQRQDDNPLWHPSCTRRVSDGMCNCG